MLQEQAPVEPAAQARQHPAVRVRSPVHPGRRRVLQRAGTDPDAAAAARRVRATTSPASSRCTARTGRRPRRARRGRRGGAGSADDRDRGGARAGEGEARRPRRGTVLAAARATWPEHSQVWLASGELLEKDQPADAGARVSQGDRARRRRRARVPRARADPARAAGRQRRRGDAARAGREGAELGRRPLPARAAARCSRRSCAARSSSCARCSSTIRITSTRGSISRARCAGSGKLDEAISQTRSAFDRAAQPLDIADELFWLLCEADDMQGAIDLLTLLDDDRSDVDALATVAAPRSPARPDRRGAARSQTRIAAQDAEAGAIALGRDPRRDGRDRRRTASRAASRMSTPLAEASTRFVLARRIAASALLAAQPAAACARAARSRPAAQKPKDLELAFLAAIAAADAGAVGGCARALVGVARHHAEAQLVRARFEDHVHDERRGAADPAAARQAQAERLDRAEPRRLPARRPQAAPRRRPDAARACPRAGARRSGGPRLVGLDAAPARARPATRSAPSTRRRATRRASPRSCSTSPRPGPPTTSRRPRRGSSTRPVALRPLPDVKRRIDELRATLVIK